MLDFLAALFGSRIKLPRDRVTRIPRAARKAAQPHTAAMQKAVDVLAGLPGIADVSKLKRLPKGFFEQVETFHAAHDRYIESVRASLGLDDAAAAGTPEGKGACFAGPFGVSGPESLLIYRTIRTWKDFPQVAQKLGELGEQQFKDIQALHTGKDPEKIRMTSKAAGLGRKQFAERGLPCPFLDQAKGRCRIWEVRPSCCRQHFTRGDKALADPRHERHAEVQVVNIRIPIRAQVALTQLDRRMALGLSPFAYASQLQLLQLAEGQLIQEVGEAPQRMQQDGRVIEKANRNVAHAKKFQKKKAKKKKK
ncbi:YkgJ family cysteine cluster protein [Nannocystaceae bacterium ST9]